MATVNAQRSGSELSQEDRARLREKLKQKRVPCLPAFRVFASSLSHLLACILNIVHIFELVCFFFSTLSGGMEAISEAVA